MEKCGNCKHSAIYDNSDIHAKSISKFLRVDFSRMRCMKWHEIVLENSNCQGFIHLNDSETYWRQLSDKRFIEVTKKKPRKF